jgi:hypothetical protein
MSQQTVIGALNRLLAHQCYSLVDYLIEAPLSRPIIPSAFPDNDLRRLPLCPAIMAHFLI